MTPLLLALSLAQATEPGPTKTHNTGGISLSAFAVQGPARHTITPGLGAWVSYTPRPWAITGELGVTQRTRENEQYFVRTQTLRGSAVVELALGTRPMTFHAGIGPALSLTRGLTEWGQNSSSTVLLDPGLRVRMALDGPLGETLAWQWQLGVTSRGVYAWDYDTGLGLGVRW